MDYSPAPLTLNQKAIDAALESHWDEALKLNKKIIKDDPQNVDALNRQARVYLELGKINLAKKYYSEVLKFDPYNPIAIKNLKIIKSFKSKNHTPKTNGQDKLSGTLFLQEPGKTKMVNLLNVAEPQKLSQAYCGMRVEMTVKNRKITIVDQDSNYLGVMPDDFSYKLQRLIKGGNRFEFFIKSIRVNGLSILVKETFRSKKFKNQPSFLENSDANLTIDILTPMDGHGDEEPEHEDGEGES